MRYGAICKALHVLPRSGGILDQPNPEMLRLEKILDVFERYRDYREQKDKVRDKNRGRHAPQRRRVVT